MAAANAFADVERDSTLWFFDGNIVLVAQGNVAFRVHKSILALHSEFFAGMFQQSLLVPHGSSDEETIDGCPVIPLDDTAHDMRQFLLVVYQTRKTYMSTPDDITFPVLAALMRIGDKYGVHDLVDQCVPSFRRMRPMSLRSVKDATKHRAAIKFAPHDAVEALHLCRIVTPLAEEPDILVWMLFFCAQLDEHDLRDGTTRADGTVEKLSDADVERILEFKNKLQLRGEDVLDAALAFSRWPAKHKLYDSDCRSSDPDADTLPCMEKFEKHVIDHFPEEVMAAFQRGDPFEPWFMERMSEVAKNDWMCSRCIEEVIQTQASLRKDYWDELPTLAGITEDDIDWDTASLCSV